MVENVETDLIVSGRDAVRIQDLKTRLDHRNEMDDRVFLLRVIDDLFNSRKAGIKLLELAKQKLDEAIGKYHGEISRGRLACNDMLDINDRGWKETLKWHHQFLVETRDMVLDPKGPLYGVMPSVWLDNLEQFIKQTGAIIE